MKCTSLTKSGNNCKNHAMIGSLPPLCSVHQGIAHALSSNKNRETHGFYSTTYTAAELSSLLQIPTDTGLIPEIALARISLQRLAIFLTDTSQLDSDSLFALTSLLFTGTSTIARLVRTQNSLGSSGADSLHQILGESINLLYEEYLSSPISPLFSDPSPKAT